MSITTFKLLDLSKNPAVIRTGIHFLKIKILPEPNLHSFNNQNLTELQKKIKKNLKYFLNLILEKINNKKCNQLVYTRKCL